MRRIRSILWYSRALSSMEICYLRKGPDCWSMSGTVLALANYDPVEIRYGVICDGSWHTRSCTVTAECNDRIRKIRLDADKTGSWTCNGRPAPLLRGIMDVDLGFSPTTNTIPVRRLSLATGGSARIHVVWIRFPEFDVVPSEQVYTRISGRVYRFESGDGKFLAEIEVDRHGVVIRYGNLWREIADNRRRTLR